MNHWLILPLLVPLLVGGLLIAGYRTQERTKRVLSLMSCLALVGIAGYLLVQSFDGQLRSYHLGGWAAPFGISLLLDRLSAALLLLTAVLGAVVVVYASRGEDSHAPNLHALLQFQLLGINGAFLTADLFNLFVFFEILLIASYALLVYGNHAQRVRAGIGYVLLNLLGSSLFLLGIGILYGLLGSLNMAELGVRIAQADPAHGPLLKAAGFCLLLVFGLKAAVLPLGFWLPNTYAVASAPVAALFAIMTKVGLYAMLRVFSLLYGEQAGDLAGFIEPWLFAFGLVTLLVATLGALAAKSLQSLIGYLVLISVGTLLSGISVASAPALSASLYYLLHSTLAVAAMFLLADIFASQRGAQGTALVFGLKPKQPLMMGSLFFLGAIALAGLPPLAGFFGKVLLLQAALSKEGGWLLWPVLLIATLCVVVSLTRAGSCLLWRAEGQSEAQIDPAKLSCVAVLLLAVLGLVIFAEPVFEFLQACATQLLHSELYLATARSGQ